MNSKDFIGPNGPTDNDFYLYTMKAAVFHWYPDVSFEKAYTCRTQGISHDFLKEYLDREIKRISTFKHSPEDIEFLSNIKTPVFKNGYLRFLENQTWNANDVSFKFLDNGDLDLRIKSPWLNGMDWELYLLPVISESWTRHNMSINCIAIDQIIEYNLKNLKIKLDLLKKEAPELKFIDMGTRRRAHRLIQKINLRYIMQQHPDCLAGTSNVMLAKDLNLKVFGTHAHEWDQAHLAFAHPLKAKQLAMLRWMQTFDGDCGICLTDTFTTKHFLTIFNKLLANAYTGLRHDSGPWDVWAKNMLNHYRKLGVDPKTKTLVFSDSLDFPKMIEIYNSLKDYCKVGFGIGTNLMNDVCDLWKALSIVIKMTKCDGIDVLKISDCPEKTMCENEALKYYAFDVFGV